MIAATSVLVQPNPHFPALTDHTHLCGWWITLHSTRFIPHSKRCQPFTIISLIILQIFGWVTLLITTRLVPSCCVHPNKSTSFPSCSVTKKQVPFRELLPQKWDFVEQTTKMMLPWQLKYCSILVQGQAISILHIIIICTSYAPFPLP